MVERMHKLRQRTGAFISLRKKTFLLLRPKGQLWPSGRGSVP